VNAVVRQQAHVRKVTEPKVTKGTSDLIAKRASGQGWQKPPPRIAALATTLDTALNRTSPDDHVDELVPDIGDHRVREV